MIGSVALLIIRSTVQGVEVVEVAVAVEVVEMVVVVEG
jgi:uncharacterized membrane protein YvlD (DUF360 family)